MEIESSPIFPTRQPAKTDRQLKLCSLQIQHFRNQLQTAKVGSFAICLVYHLCLSLDSVPGSLDNSLCANEVASLSALFGADPNNLVIDLPQSEEITISIPSGSLLDFSEIEVDLNSLLDPSSAFCSSADTFSDDVLESFPTSSTMNKRTSQLVQLDALRKHQACIQKQIQSLCVTIIVLSLFQLEKVHLFFIGSIKSLHQITFD